MLISFKALLIISTVLFGYGVVQAQSSPVKISIPVQNPFAGDKILPAEETQKTEECFFRRKNIHSDDSLNTAQNIEKNSRLTFFKSKSENETCDRSDEREKDAPENGSAQTNSGSKSGDKFHWKPALQQSVIFLGLQHGTRIVTQRRTNRELGGPFFHDWFKSVAGVHGWKDGDNIFVNYVAHPLQGGLTGRIFINNSDNAKKQEFGKSKDYWKSRLKTMVWSAVWSTQFEIGPVSEASLGNLGLRENSHYKSTYLDLVITPTVGTGVIIGEDAVDKYILKNWLEKKNGYQLTNKIRIWRSILTPSISFANLLRLKAPWKRNDR